jgi:O-antigen/teichoic acid export membrane protein
MTANEVKVTTAEGTQSVAQLPIGEEAAPGRVEERGISTRKSLMFVYGAYFFRYIYLLILIPFYGRVLGAAAYGQVLAAMSLYQIIWLSVEYGFPVVGARDLASTTDKAIIAAQFGRHIKARLLMSVLGIALGVGAVALSPVLRADPAYGLVATALGVISAFNLGWYFQGTFRFRTSVMLEVLGFAINLCMILSLVRNSGDGLLVLESLLVSAIACTVVAYVIAIRQVGSRSLRFTGAVSLVRASTALFANRGLSMIIPSSSTYLLSLFANATQVGFYGAAERLASVGLSLMQPAGQVLIATLTRRLSSSETEAAAYRLMRKGCLAMEGFGFVLLFGALVLSPYLIPLILGPGFAESVPIMQMLGLMYPFAAFTQVVCGYVLIPLRQDTLVTTVTLLSAACSLIGILLLVRDFGGLGVAGARVMGYLVAAVMLVVILTRQGLFRRILYS